MAEKWLMHVYNRAGDLWDLARGTEPELREQGAGFTTQRGQLAWTCVLFKNGQRVAECKRGVWSDGKAVGA